MRPILGAGILIRVATLNVRNTSDRWRSRAALVVDQLAALAPDIIGLQELRRFPSQAQWMATRAGRKRLTVWQAPKTGLWGLWEGIAVLARLPVLDHDVLDLGGQHRVAQRVTVAVAGAGAGDGAAAGAEPGEVDFYNTHLASGDVGMSTRQARSLMEWMAQRPAVPQVVVGDFNSGPGSPAVGLMTQGLRSAYATIHGREPPRTVPTPLRRGSGAGSAEPGRVLDYIFVNHLVEVHDAWVTFDRPASDDDRLFPSDHFGLAATVSV